MRVSEFRSAVWGQGRAAVPLGAGPSPAEAPRQRIRSMTGRWPAAPNASQPRPTVPRVKRVLRSEGSGLRAGRVRPSPGAACRPGGTSWVGPAGGGGGRHSLHSPRLDALLVVRLGRPPLRPVLRGQRPPFPPRPGFRASLLFPFRRVPRAISGRLDLRGSSLTSRPWLGAEGPSGPACRGSSRALGWTRVVRVPGPATRPDVAADPVHRACPAADGAGPPPPARPQRDLLPLAARASPDLGGLGARRDRGLASSAGDGGARPGRGPAGGGYIARGRPGRGPAVGASPAPCHAPRGVGPGAGAA